MMGQTTGESMQLEIREEFRGFRGHEVDEAGVFASKGFLVGHQRIVDGRLRPFGRLPIIPTDSLMAMLPVISAALRKRVNNAITLASGTLLVATYQAIYRTADAGRSWERVHIFREGTHIAVNGMCEDLEGRIYYGEYMDNADRSMGVRVYRSDDDGKNFLRVYEIAPGTVRHIHFMQTDPQTGNVWMGTGDNDPECFIVMSEDQGQRFELMGKGSQTWRAVQLIFDKDHIYWGTASGRDKGPGATNTICRMNRDATKVDLLKEVQGPVHSAAITAGGVRILTTGVEDTSKGYDNHARVWASPDGDKWMEIAKFKKSLFPTALDYGIVRLLPGQEKTRDLWLSMTGLEGGNRLALARIAR